MVPADNQTEPQIPPAPPTEYEHLFHDEDADVVIRSSDNVFFRAHRIILAKASTFFKAVFMLPQSPPTPDEPDNPDYFEGLPIVPMLKEPAEVLDILLTFCYPMDDPDITSIHTFCAVLDAALEYGMEPLARKLRGMWTQMAERDTLRAFALACFPHRRWSKEAHIAATLSLERPFWPLEPPLGPEFKFVNADTILRLISYHRKCGLAALRLCENYEWRTGILESQKCLHCSHRYKHNTQGLQLQDFFKGFMQEMGPLLVAQPSSKTMRNTELLNNVIQRSYQTFPCELPMHVVDRINCVVELFAKEIDRIVSDVSIFLVLFTELPVTQITVRYPLTSICNTFASLAVNLPFLSPSCSHHLSSYIVY